MLLSQFFKERSGAFAPYFALALLPLLGLMGASIDYARIENGRQKLQTAADAAILAAASGAQDPSQFVSMAEAWLEANLDGMDADASVALVGTNAVLTVTGRMDLPFLAAAGRSEIVLRAEAGVPADRLAFNGAVQLDEAIARARRDVMRQIDRLPYRYQAPLRARADAELDRIAAELAATTRVSLSR